MWPPTGLIPWFSITEGNTYATLLHHPFLFKGKPAQCSRGSKKHFWRCCRGVYAQVKTYQVPITNSYPSHYIICHLPLVFLSPTSPLPFYSPFFLYVFLFVFPRAFYLLASLLAKSLWILIRLLIFLRDPITMNQLLVSFVH